MQLPKIKKISRSLVCEYVSPFDFAFSQNASFVLLKGDESSKERYSILACDPLLIFTTKGSELSLQTAQGKQLLKGEPFACLQKMLDHFGVLADHGEHRFNAALLGALSYDLKDQLENMQAKARDDLQLPEMIFLLCKNYYVFDEYNKTLEHIKVESDAEVIAENFPEPTLQVGKIDANFSEQAYCAAVQSVVDEIAAGEMYQANISQRFELPFKSDPFKLFKKVYQNNPAPMMAYLQTKEFAIISTSPERFLRRQGSFVESMPIKGTRPRGKDVQEDQEMSSALLASEKDAAELAMIIDLVRNDLGKLAKAGSVKLESAKRLERYANVFHLVADIVAETSADVSAVELIKACFPAGSITGCPKLRAMEAIEAVEPVKRSFYCGSIGYLDFAGNFDFNVAIRTLLLTKQKLYFNLGGGIVFDSLPQAEYQETLAKGASIFNLLRKSYE